MRHGREPFAVRSEDGASRLNQLGFALLVLPAILLSRTQLDYLVCIPLSEEVHAIAGDDEVTCLLLVNMGPMLAFLACALAGAVGGGLFAWGRAPAHAGLAGGALACIGGTVLTYLALLHRERFLLIEVAVAWLLGCVPGVLVYKDLVERAARRAWRR